MAVQPVCRCVPNQHEDEICGPSKDKAGDTDPYTEGRITSYPPISRHIPDRLTSLIPPFNFGAVDDASVYRSSFPMPENFTFLASLKLKTILTLVPEPFPQEYRDFMKEHNIKQVVVPIPANKEFVRINSDEAHEALQVIMDRSNHPLLVHCNKGKHRTGCIIGSFRKIQGEALTEIIDEYHVYADPKARILDEAFLKGFDEAPMVDVAKDNGYVTDDNGLARTVTKRLGQMGFASKLATAVGMA